MPKNQLFIFGLSVFFIVNNLLAESLAHNDYIQLMNDNEFKMSLTILTEAEKGSYKNKTVVIPPAEAKAYIDAIANKSKSYTEINERPSDKYVELKGYGFLTFRSKSSVINIDITSEYFFWNSERKLKYAFVSNSLKELLLEKIKTIDGTDLAVRALTVTKSRKRE